MGIASMYGYTQKLINLIKNPRAVVPRLKKRLGLRIEPDCPTLLQNRRRNGPSVWHIAFFQGSNAGDILLPITLRDLFTSQLGAIHWHGQHVHTVVDERSITAINRSKGLIIGGGGMFLRDTNPNQLSGWQWSCSIDMLKQIRVPVAIFAVGYNRFRGQPDFDPVFSDHLKVFAEKCVYIGLRNHGSIQAVCSYLPDSLHHKLVYQPCMTTLLTYIYPERFINAINSDPFIALNCAFDRESLRYGDEGHRIQKNIAQTIARLNRDVRIKYYAHLNNDEAFLPYLDEAGVEYERVNMNRTKPGKIIDAYREPSLAIGMRGHAQLIPFGCQTPILSLISHNKMRWFLDDIDASDWGVEIQDPDMPDKLYDKAVAILNTQNQIKERVEQAQWKLWKISSDNVVRVKEAFNL